MQTYYIYLPFVPEVVTVKSGTHWKCFMLFLPPKSTSASEKRRIRTYKRFSVQNSEENLRIHFQCLRWWCILICLFGYIIWKNPIECRNTRPRKIGCPMKIYAVGVPVCLWACKPVSLITFSYMHLLLLNIVDFCRIINSFSGTLFPAISLLKATLST